jgi:hypothetical protein
MARQLIGCMILLLILQAMTPVSADVLPQSQMQHCHGHEAAGEDCACCSGELAMNGGCASLCSAMIAIPTTSMHLPRIVDSEHSRLDVRAPAGPAYLPLNPPPIP